MSLYQYKRDEDQQRHFKRALESMHILYAHEAVQGFTRLACRCSHGVRGDECGLGLAVLVGPCRVYSAAMALDTWQGGEGRDRPQADAARQKGCG